MDEPAQPPALLAGDGDRDASVQSLTTAVAEGRLTLEEFSDRVDQAHTARTQQELALLTRDLPAPAQTTAVTAREPERYRATFSRLVRSGPWELPARSSFRCLFGTIVLDLSQARLAGAEVELEVFNLFGTVTLLVPAGVDVSVSGGGMFASQVLTPPAERPPAGAPRLRVTVGGPGGTLYVRSPDRER